MSNLATTTQAATWATTPTVQYGHDLFGVNDLDPGMLECDGRVCLAQALARRLITPRGGLLDDPNYGYDLTGFLNDDVSHATLASMQGQIVAEMMKDERVIAATASVVFVAGQLIVTISITDSVGPFPLVLAVSSVTVQVLSIGQL